MGDHQPERVRNTAPDMDSFCCCFTLPNPAVLLFFISSHHGSSLHLLFFSSYHHLPSCLPPPFTAHIILNHFSYPLHPIPTPNLSLTSLSPSVLSLALGNPKPTLGFLSPPPSSQPVPLTPPTKQVFPIAHSGDRLCA